MSNPMDPLHVHLLTFSNFAQQHPTLTLFLVLLGGAIWSLAGWIMFDALFESWSSRLTHPSPAKLFLVGTASVIVGYGLSPFSCVAAYMFGWCGIRERGGVSGGEDGGKGAQGMGEMMMGGGSGNAGGRFAQGRKVGLSRAMGKSGKRKGTPSSASSGARLVRIDETEDDGESSTAVSRVDGADERTPLLGTGSSSASGSRK